LTGQVFTIPDGEQSGLLHTFHFPRKKEIFFEHGCICSVKKEFVLCVSLIIRNIIS